MYLLEFDSQSITAQSLPVTTGPFSSLTISVDGVQRTLHLLPLKSPNVRVETNAAANSALYPTRGVTGPTLKGTLPLTAKHLTFYLANPHAKNLPCSSGPLASTKSLGIVGEKVIFC